MMDLTFLIPTRIETEDRLRNIISSVSYLLRHVPAKVIVKEVSGRNTFKFRALPEIKKLVDTENLTCLYEENNDPLFCKSKVLNDLIVASDTKVVATMMQTAFSLSLHTKKHMILLIMVTQT